MMSGLSTAPASPAPDAEGGPGTAARAPVVRAGMLRAAARRPAVATAVLTAALTGGATVLAFAPGGWASSSDPRGWLFATGVSISWWQLALMFAAASVFVAHVEVNDESHTFSLSEIPLILGLLFATPGQLVAGRLLGEALVLTLYARQPLGKLAFNLSLFLAETTLATGIHGLIAPSGGELTWTACAAALLAAAVAGQFGAAAVWAVIRLHGGEESLGGMMLVAGVTTTANASLAVVTAVVTVTAPWALVPLVAVGAAVVVVYRGYASLRRRYGGLRVLYDFTGATSGARGHAETTHQLLAETRRLMHARVSMILLPDVVGSHGGWRLVATRHPEGTDDPTPTTALPPQTLPGWLRDHVLDRNIVRIPAGTHDAGYRAVLGHLGVRDLVAAPMIAGDLITGVLLAADRLGDVNTFDDEDALLLATLARQSAIALENAGLIEQLHEQIEARESDALHDSLTGLPNRSMFLRSLEAELAREEPGSTAVLLLDLDGFKEVNDTLGHRTGDRLLVEVAERLRLHAPEAGTVARLGGDEFAMVLPSRGLPPTPAAAFLEIAEALGTALREPFTLDALTLEVGASIGVAVAPDHSGDAIALLQRADVAMYSAKNAQLTTALYDPGADWHTQDRLRLAHELRRALADGRITVAYQPIARTQDGRVTGVEALARWQHDELGPISPDTFIPVAERTGLIHELTWHVLTQALTRARAWRTAGHEIVVNVNLSVQLLRDRELPRKILELLARHRVPATALRLEITESGIMTDPRGMIGTLEELGENGISLAIDDFGTGQSSLAYLQRLPVSQVKIDKSLVLPMTTDANARTIVRSVIELAHNLDLDAVGEGVEDDDTLGLLRMLGCDFMQGNRLARPLTPERMSAWLDGRDDPPPPAAR